MLCLGHDSASCPAQSGICDQTIRVLSVELFFIHTSSFWRHHPLLSAHLILHWEEKEFLLQNLETSVYDSYLFLPLYNWVCPLLIKSWPSIHAWDPISLTISGNLILLSYLCWIIPISIWSVAFLKNEIKKLYINPHLLPSHSSFYFTIKLDRIVVYTWCLYFFTSCSFCNSLEIGIHPHNPIVH